MTWRHPPIAAHLLSSWISDRCDLGRSLFEQAGLLWDSWREYAHGRNAEPGSPAEFAEAMERRGYMCDRLPGQRRRIRWGLRLRQLPRCQRQGEGEKFGAPCASAPPPPTFGDFFSAERSFGGPAALVFVLGTPRAGAAGAKPNFEWQRATAAATATGVALRRCAVAIAGLFARAAEPAIIFRRRVR